MSDAFQEREKGFESKFKLDEELKFKAQSRGNRMLAEWLADKLGLNAAQREAYGKELVLADLEKPGHEDLIAKVMKDVAARKAHVTRHDVEREIKRCHAAALDSVVKEQKAKKK
ncbi:MAG: DUF1476 domain-containing protein [Pseudomonadota bacterium]